MIVLSLSILDLRTFDYSLPTLSVSGSLTRAGRSTVSYSLALHCPVSLGSGGESVKDAAKVVVVFEVPTDLAGAVDRSGNEIKEAVISTEKDEG